MTAGMKRRRIAVVFGILIPLAGVLLGSGCSPPAQQSCAPDECRGTDGTCVGPCPAAGTTCTTKPVGNCSAAVNGVSCCVTSKGASSSGGTSGGSSSGCTSKVCCGGLFQCNGACYATCTPGSQPCCTATNCTCFTPCC